MSHKNIFLPVTDPFGGVRQEFERRMGVSSIDAVMDNGVLSITMSRKAELQLRKVTVRPATV